MSVTLLNSAARPALVAASRATASSFLQLAQPEPRILMSNMRSPLPLWQVMGCEKSGACVHPGAVQQAGDDAEHRHPAHVGEGFAPPDDRAHHQHALQAQLRVGH